MSVKNRFKVNPTKLQANVFQFLESGHPYSLIVGEAGTGKDFCSIYHALTMLYNKNIAKIILVKPLIEVGSSIGYLPGPQPLTSNVLTPSGWKQIKDLKIGEKIITPDGGTSNVVNKSAVNKEPVYEIKTTDGRKMYCATNHLFHTMTDNDKKHRLDTKKFKKDYSGSVKSLLEIINTLYTKKGKLNHFLPFTSPCEFTNVTKKVIPPYTLGVMLGDGSMSNIGFCSYDDDIVNKIKEEISSPLIKLYSGKNRHFRFSSLSVNSKPGRRVITKNINTGKTSIYNNINSFLASGECAVTKSALNYKGNSGKIINNIKYYFGEKECLSTNVYKNELIRLDLLDKKAETKFIPKEYIYKSTIQERIELLRGLMDSDGTNDKKAAAYTTTSPALAKDIMELVRSLGGRATCYSRNRVNRVSFSGERQIKPNHVSYELSINLDINPFYLPRKAKQYNPRYKHLIGIASITKVEDDYVQCIEIDSKDGLYITDDFVVTHNSEKDKFKPYAESMLEIVRLLIGPAETSKLENSNLISFEPLQFMRGSTYNHSCVILSEAQNATLHQLITFLTRKGKTSKFILNGDFLQADIRDSGFKKMLNILPIPEIGLMELGEEYQMRDAVVSKISRLYRKHLENTYNDQQSFNFRH